jgi:hypothetical protein
MATGFSFLFGGNTGETPDSLKQKRDYIRALMGASNAPRNVGEGLNSLGDGLVAGILNSRVNAAQTSGETSANSAFNDAITGYLKTGDNSALGSPSPSPLSAPSSITPGTPNDIQTSFLDTVKSGGLSNPYGLAAVAATGQAESGFSPQNAGRTWNDGANNAGGIMSWNGPRLANLQKFAGGSNGTPQQQGQFFLQENPQLITALNNAKSVGEAQQIMNNAWAFKGYNQPGNPNAAHRLALANGFLPQFQSANSGAQAPNQVASLDPSAGMPQPGAAQQMQATSPAPQPANIPVPTARPDQVAAPISQPSPAPVQMAGGDGFPQSSGPAGIDPRLLRALSNPFLNEGQKAALQVLVNQQLEQQRAAQDQQTWMARQAYEEQQKQADPAYQLNLKKAQTDLANVRTPEQELAAQQQIWQQRQDAETKAKQADPAYQVELQKSQLDLERAKKTPGQIKVVGSKAVLFPDDGSPPIDVTPSGSTGGKFRFDGSSVEGQALNGLIDAGKLTEEQAQQMGAGKTITGPNGEMLFLTPQSIFGQGQPQAPQAPQQQQGIDIFAGQPPQAQQADPQTAPQSVQQSAPAQDQQNAPIPLTAPKAPSKDELDAAGFADRLNESGGIIDNNENQGLNTIDQYLAGRWVPGFIGNGIIGKTNPDFQLFDQARRNFTNAQLRRESGAVISPEEEQNANKQYFPVPGDQPEVIAQKRANRAAAIKAMSRSAGPTYKIPQAAKTDALSQARDAISKGASRDAVIQRLRENGIDPTGL